MVKLIHMDNTPEKEPVEHFFGALRGVWLNNTKLNSNNLHRFALMLRYSDKNVAFYAYRKGSRQFIYHDKPNDEVDWCENLRFSIEEAKIELYKEELALAQQSSRK